SWQELRRWSGAVDPRGGDVENRLEDLVREPPGGKVRDGHAREEARALVSDRVQQVCLAETHTAVDEKRIVGARGQLGDRLARRLRELIRRADNERVERVARIQALDRTVPDRPLQSRRRHVSRDALHADPAGRYAR